MEGDQNEKRYIAVRKLGTKRKGREKQTESQRAIMAGYPNPRKFIPLTSERQRKRQRERQRGRKRERQRERETKREIKRVREAE